jgi:alkylhydroperoxidase family enzyme
MTANEHEPAAPTEPRLTPLPHTVRTDRQHEVLERLLVGQTAHIYETLVRAPEATATMTTLGRTLRGGLALRHREILILRTGWNCGSNYEFAQHQRLALEGGMEPADMDRIVAGPDAPGWEPFERVLCRAADELHERHDVNDETWAAMRERYDDVELISTVLLVGYYHMVSFSLNTFRTPLEPGAVGFLR